MIVRSFLVISALLSSVYSGCVFLHCPASPQAIPIKCEQCSTCDRQSMKYCIAMRNHTCACIPSVPAQCSKAEVKGFELMTLCKIKDNHTLPQPIVRNRGRTAISVVIPRFFSQPDYNGLHLSGLTLISRFQKENVTCEDVYSIKAQKIGNNDCILRVHIHMPGIDHKTDNHYYYDDGSELESEFAIDVFEEAQFVQFYLEANVGNESIIKGGSVVISGIARSDPIIHKMVYAPPAPPQSHRMTANNSTD